MLHASGTQLQHHQVAYIPPPPPPPPSTTTVTTCSSAAHSQQWQTQQPLKQQQSLLPTPVPFRTPFGIEAQDVPWLADLIARQAVRLFDARHLEDLTLAVAVGHHYALHTAQAQVQVYPPGSAPTITTCLAALKQYHRPADMIVELHQLLTTAASPYTNPLLGVVQLGENALTCLIVPFHPLGNLRQYIADNQASLTALQQMQIIHDIASGLEFLHQRGTHHLNLHSANVLISMSGMAILTDFGRTNTRAEVGQPPKPTFEQERARSLATVFMAPEILVNERSYSSLSEVYSLGMIMFELLTGHVAFEHELGNPGLANRIMFGRKDTIPANLANSPGPAYETLILNCWKLNPRERPHLSELKQQLESLMAEFRNQDELTQRQHVQAQQQQMQHHLNQQQRQQQHQPNNTSMPLSPTVLTPPVLYTANFITTTQIIVTESVRSSAVSTLDSMKQDGLSSSQTQTSSTMSDTLTTVAPKKPVEAWFIGQAAAPAIAQQQRDALPISTRALEISSGHRKNKSVSGADTLFTAPLGNTQTIPVPNIPVAHTSTKNDPETLEKSHAAASEFSIGTQESDKENIPCSPTPSGSSSTVSTPFSASAWPMPPPLRTSNATQSSHTMRSGESSAPVVAAASLQSSAAVADSKPTPIQIPSRTTSFAAPLLTPLDHSPARSVVSPTMTPSPASLFKPGRNTMIMADAIDQQQNEEQEAKPAAGFNWRQIPRIPEDMPERQHVHDVATSHVQIVSNDYTRSGDGQDNRHEILKNEIVNQTHGKHHKFKSYIAAVENPDQSQPPSVTVPAQVLLQQTPQHHQPQRSEAAIEAPQAMTAISTKTSMNNIGRTARESVLVIPAFPEPPSTLHNRRISNIDVRFRANARKNMLPRLQEDSRANSCSSDDSGPRSGKTPSRGVPAAMPQEAMTGASATHGLATRGAYTPITSSEDVPVPTQSTDIYSAAKNGDMEELQHFLFSALNSSVSDGSSNSNGNNLARPSSRKSQASAADILDEYEPIERLPVLCCAAVARKNKYRALNMVLKAGANVEGKEQRGGNTPLHLVCETADPPLAPVAQIRFRQDEKSGNEVGVEGVINLLEDPEMSQLSLLDLSQANGEHQDEDDINDDETEEGQEAALKLVDELDEQEQQALKRVKEDLETTFSMQMNEDEHGLTGGPSLRQHGSVLNYYQMNNQILLKGGLEDQIRLLVIAGAPLDAPNSRGETPLLLLLRHHDSVSALATFLRLGADPTIMAPFGPGLNPTEIQIDPKSVTTPSSQKKFGIKFFSSRQNPLLVQQQLQQDSGEDPNHILVMHGSALAHAAYYLRVGCVKYLLENEVECSDPALIEQAIIACQYSVAAQVNPSLIDLQNKILLLLERNWRGEEACKRRCRVADRVLNRKARPKRSNALLVALSVSVGNGVSVPSESASAACAAASSSLKIRTLRMNGSAGGGMGSGPLSNHSGKISASLGPIPTTHLYATDGPTGQEIQLISHHGFQASAPTSPTSPQFPGLMNGFQQQMDYQLYRHDQNQGASEGGGAQKKDLLRKIRNIGKR
ncbi:hypothetical protein BG004_000019 [Podila humilis]|nr:hypothetical protein BG004_000019 [Podila humilis]